jgi:hypothetical protein
LAELYSFQEAFAFVGWRFFVGWQTLPTPNTTHTITSWWADV